MISRYTRPVMAAVWSEERKLATWLEIEVLACEALAELGQVPAADARTIRERARFDADEVARIEERTHHDVIAFLENVATYVGPASRWIHQGLTSSDLLDTTLAVQMMAATDLLLEEVDKLRQVVARRAQEHRRTVMIGRSHGIHAEPITFGLKLALMWDEFGRARERLVQTRERIRVGKLSGAVGTHAHFDPRAEAWVCERLGLRPAALATQVIQRDRHAEFMQTLALVAASIERWATEFRHLQRTEVLEVEERFAAGQKGSSAMPHKRNPITGERLCGLARVIRGHAVTALENVALWHERDISHSSAERVILPDACTLLDYMLHKLTSLTDGLVVYPEAMERNLHLTRGLYHSQTVLLELTRRGLERQAAYEAVQRAAMATWAGEGGSLAENLAREPVVAGALTPEEIARLCSLEHHLRHVDDAFRRLGLDS